MYFSFSENVAYGDYATYRHSNISQMCGICMSTKAFPAHLWSGYEWRFLCDNYEQCIQRILPFDCYLLDHLHAIVA